MKKVRLYGEAGRKFGRVFSLAVDTPAEAIRALCVIRPGFRQYLQDNAAAPFRVLVGDAAVDEKGLAANVGSAKVIKIVPVVAGAKDGWGQILLGAVLITAGIMLAPYTAGTSLAWATSALGTIGWSMALGGVAQLLAKAPESMGAGFDATNDLETWSFGSPTLTTGQGGCVPLLYGTHRVGGHLISAGIDAQTWQDKGFGGAAPDNAGTRGGDGDTSPWVWAVAP